MRVWSDPYLWIHLAGVAALPLLLEVCLVGFALGEPLLPPSVELGLVATVGILPVLWMQWQRPFYIFSLLAVVLRPEQLTEDQRRLLTLFTLQRNRLLALLSPIGLLYALWQVYRWSPVVADRLPEAGRVVGLGIAALGFWGCNLFLQVPVSVASVLLTQASTFAATAPYPPAQIRQRFTLLGLPVSRLLPAIAPEPPEAATADSQNE